MQKHHPRPAWHKTAQRLRAKGYSFPKIVQTLGYSLSATKMAALDDVAYDEARHTAKLARCGVKRPPRERSYKPVRRTWQKLANELFHIHSWNYHEIAAALHVTYRGAYHAAHNLDRHKTRNAYYRAHRAKLAAARLTTRHKHNYGAPLGLHA